MRLKTLPLAILSLLLLTRIGYALTPQESQDGQNNAYGIEPEKFYPGTLVLELMEAAEAEIDAAVREAYAEGYKAAMLRHAPEAAMYKAEAETLRKELDAERKKRRWFWPSVGITGGASFALGFLSHTLSARR
jgi:hypothetical protein